MLNSLFPVECATDAGRVFFPAAVVSADPLSGQGFARLFEHAVVPGPVSIVDDIWAVDRDAAFGLVALVPSPATREVDLVFEIAHLRTLPTPPVVVVVAPPAGVTPTVLLAVGAGLVLSGRETPAELEAGLTAAAAGFAVVASALTSHLALAPAPATSVVLPDRLGDVPAPVRLTPRQRAVAALVAEGCSNKVIAARLGLAEGTVKIHLTAILRAFSVSNRTGLVSRLLRPPAIS